MLQDSILQPGARARKGKFIPKANDFWLKDGRNREEKKAANREMAAQISLRPSTARFTVASSIYSRSLPNGIP
jgi:hypothetical protein